MESPAKLSLACGMLAAAFGVAFCFRKPAEQAPPLLVQEESQAALLRDDGRHAPEAVSRLVGRIEPLDAAAGPTATLDARSLPGFAPAIAAGTGPPDADATTQRLWQASRQDAAASSALAPVTDLNAPPDLARAFPEGSPSENPSGVNGSLIAAQLGGSAPARPWDDAGADGADELRTHRVADGDTLSKLAQRYLGAGARYLEIFELNRGTLATPNVLPIGATLRIPPRGGAAAPTETNPLDAGTAGAWGAGRPLTPIQPGALFSTGETTFDQRTYRVQPEDTLASIARRFYGDAARLPELLAANRDRLHDADDIREGLLLVIP